MEDPSNKYIYDGDGRLWMSTKPPMKKSTKWITFAVCSVFIVIFGYFVWHGYFDQGDFRLLSSVQSPTEQFAMVAKRSDHEALNGDQVFVLLGNHIFTPVELRWPAPIFRIQIILSQPQP
jgi:hypothetical protein